MRQKQRRGLLSSQKPPPPTAEHTRGTSSENLRAREGSESPLLEAHPGLALLSSDSCALHHSTSCVGSGLRSRLPQQQGAHYDTSCEISDSVWLTHQKVGTSGQQGHLSGRKHSLSPGWPGTSQEELLSLPFSPERVLAWTCHVATLQSGGWEGGVSCPRSGQLLNHESHFLNTNQHVSHTKPCT